MFEIRDIVLFGILAGVLAALVLFRWSWGRARRRFFVVGGTTSAGFVAWNLVLNATNATGFNVDAPLIPISWADAGSGVLAFFSTALILGLATERAEPSHRVLGAAALSGLIATGLDLFVL